jgi:CRISPR-associated protein Csy1
MNNDFIKEVKKNIKGFIDAIDESKISARNLDKLESLQKDFLDEIYLQLQPIFKSKTELRKTVAAIKKRKAAKGSNKKDKIDFNKNIINELVGVLKNHAVLPDIITQHKLLGFKIEQIKKWNKYEQWFAWALDFGKESYLATHIAKLTHSSSKGSSIDVRHYNSCNKYKMEYVCTEAEYELDTAYPDNKFSSISQLYKIEVNGAYIGDLLRGNGDKYLCDFTDNKQLLQEWVSCFANHIKNTQKQSYFLSKQTYFPTADKQYHLLLPLTSSSLVHAIHLEHKKYFDDAERLEARKQKDEGKYSTFEHIRYPNKAYIHVTGSNHSNASSLNGKRGGRIALMSTMPPQWRLKQITYKDRTSLFDRSLAFELQQPINDLRNYLLLIKSKELSISSPKRNAAVRTKLEAISDFLFEYISLINLNESDDWTIESELPDEQQLLFEPWREDEKAKSLKVNKQWQKKLSQDYGRWLNRQLNKNKKLMATNVHADLWADIFSHKLREMAAIQEVTI